MAVDGVGPHSDPSCRPPIDIDDVGGQPRIDVAGTVQRRSGVTGKHPVSPRPQPGGLCAQHCRRAGTSFDVHVLVHGDEPGSQFMARQAAIGQCLAADERIAHAGSVRRHTDSHALTAAHAAM